MSEQDSPFDADLLTDLKPIGDTKVAPAVGIAALALNMALKFHDINTVQEGGLYQQYKNEGKNMAPLHLDMVLETAKQMELFLLGASERIAKIVIEAVVEGVDDRDEDEIDDEIRQAVDAAIDEQAEKAENNQKGEDENDVG